MNAVPKLWSTGIGPNFEALDEGQIKTVPMMAGEGMWIQCEVTQPASMVGRNVNVYFAPETIDSLLREAKATAVRARSKPLAQ